MNDDECSAGDGHPEGADGVFRVPGQAQSEGTAFRKLKNLFCAGVSVLHHSINSREACVRVSRCGA